ncbi:MAG: hypothetical protein FWH43_04675 [Endomicrobia bacterium]|nr:hypothetical protein [Endomicrobiia bacterium]
MKKTIAVILAVSLFAADLFAVAAGTTLFNFLKIPLNASQAATAGINAFSVNTVGSNPALIPFFDGMSLSASYAAYFQDTSFSSIDMTVPFKGGYHGINVSYGGFDYGKMDSYLEDSSSGYVKNGTFGASDAFFGASYGRIITDEIYIGAGLKYVWQTIDDSKMDGIVFTASGLYMPDETWYISGGIDNAGFAVDGYKMPSSIYLSMIDAPEMLNSMFMYGFELRIHSDETMWIKGACEFNYEKMFFARLGYNFPLNNSNSSLGDLHERNLSLGFGVEYGFFVIDYAWLPYGDLGSTNMISVRINF